MLREEIVRGSSAILIFTRTAREEAAAKNFYGKSDLHTNALIAESLIRHTVAVAKKSGIPYFIIYSDQQRGEHFGERLCNAIQEIFDAGFNNIIAIGNDCPALQPAHLVESNRLMQKNEVVLGPTDDGGVYLFGIAKKIFHADSLTSLNWKSSLLYESLIAYCSQHLFETGILEKKKDIDFSEDLSGFINQGQYISLAAKIKSILASAEKIFRELKIRIRTSLYVIQLTVRTPPAA